MSNWSINFIVELIRGSWESNEINGQDVQEIIEDLKIKGITEKLRDKLEDEFYSYVFDHQKCENCFGDTKHAGFVRESRGEFWGAPAYEEVPTKIVCQTCGHTVEI